MTEPDDRISIDDLVMRYTKQDLDEAYERGKAEQQESLNAARQLATQLGQNADEAIRAAYEQGRVRGLREATEGWKRVVEWGARVDKPHPARGEPVGAVIKLGEHSARHAPTIWDGWVTVRRERLVGPWEPAEQPETEGTQRG